MKEENKTTEEVRELLESLEQHGKNARRQKELSDLIDSLSSGTSLRAERSGARQSNLTQTKPVQVGLPPLSVGELRLLRSARNDAKRRKLYPLWWIVSAAAACLLLWLLTRPTMQETPNIMEEILVEETGTKDTMILQEEEVVKEEPVIPEKSTEKLLAEETPIKAKQPQNKSSKPTSKAVNEDPAESQLAENAPTDIVKMENSLAEITEPIDKSNTEPTPTTIEENFSPLTSHLSSPTSPQRRVIRSLNLVCYECKTENGERKKENEKWITESSQFSALRSPFEPDPNMKNGSLAFEVKLH